MQITLDNPLWAFSLAVYPEAGVSEECIALQDQRGIDVNLLLLCAYAGGVRGVTLSADDLEKAKAVVEAWQSSVIRPLREVRRALKPIDEDAARRLRGNVKKDELLAEQIEQALLWEWYRDGPAALARGEHPMALNANITALLGGRAAPNLVGAVLRQAAKI